DACVSADGVLAFVSEFGLLTVPPREPWKESWRESPTAANTEPLDAILRTAHLLRLIAHGLDKKDNHGAAKILNDHATPHLTAMLVQNAKGRWEAKFAPRSLRGALLIQAAESIADHRQF